MHSFAMQLLCALGFLAVASCVIVGVVVYYAGVARLQQVRHYKGKNGCQLCHCRRRCLFHWRFWSTAGTSSLSGTLLSAV
jgi:hypothetical protein